MPKHGLDVSACEVFRFYKLVTLKGLIEPISMIVPRRVSPSGVQAGPVRWGCPCLHRVADRSGGRVSLCRSQTSQLFPSLDSWRIFTPGLMGLFLGKNMFHMFQLNPRKNFFPLRVTEPWPRLPREAVESPSLEIFQPRLDKVLCTLLWVTLLGQGVGLGDPQRSLPTPAMLGFWDSGILTWLHGADTSSSLPRVPRAATSLRGG